MPLASFIPFSSMAAEIPSHRSSAAVSFPTTGSTYVPLSLRTSHELARNAMELRCMAQTATTTEVMSALSILADRYAALAERRRAEEISAL